MEQGVDRASIPCSVTVSGKVTPVDHGPVWVILSVESSLDWQPDIASEMASKRKCFGMHIKLRRTLAGLQDTETVPVGKEPPSSDDSFLEDGPFNSFDTGLQPSRRCSYSASKRLRHHDKILIILGTVDT